MELDLDRELDELYPRTQFYTPRYYIAMVFPRMNQLLSSILNEGSMADFNVFFDRVILPASENGAAADPALVDWRQACRDFGYYMGGDCYRAIVDGGWMLRFEKPHVLWFFRNLRLYCPEGREMLIDRIVEDRRIAVENRALFCHAVFTAQVSVARQGRDFTGLPGFWYYNRSICGRIMDVKNCREHRAIRKIAVSRHDGFRASAAMEIGVGRDNFAVFELNRELEDRKIDNRMLEHLIRRDAARCFTGLLSRHPDRVFELRSPGEWLVTVCRYAGDELAVAAVNELERQFPGIVASARDPWGNTALWNTFVNEKPTAGVRKELLRFGCDPDEKNEWGLSYRLVRDNDPETPLKHEAARPAV